MSEPLPSVLSVDVESIIERLDSVLSAHAHQSCVVTFDGDGTLWSGDVGEDVFLEAIANQMLSESARPALLECSEMYRVVAEGSPSDIARSIFQAYRASAFPESVVCEVMTWCYAGINVADLARFTHRILAERGLALRYNQKLLRILGFLRERGTRSVVISASPEFIVRQAALPLGFEAADIVAAEPLLVADRIQPGMKCPAPYAQHKVAAGRRLFGPAYWAGCFGDNVFDTDMLRAAEVAVAVSPKPALRESLNLVPGIVVLE